MAQATGSRRASCSQQIWRALGVSVAPSCLVHHIPPGFARVHWLSRAVLPPCAERKPHPEPKTPARPHIRPPSSPKLVNNSAASAPRSSEFRPRPPPKPIARPQPPSRSPQPRPDPPLVRRGSRAPGGSPPSPRPPGSSSMPTALMPSPFVLSYFRALRDSSSAPQRSRRRDHLDPALILLRFRLSSPPSLSWLPSVQALMPRFAVCSRLPSGTSTAPFCPLSFILPCRSVSSVVNSPTTNLGLLPRPASRRPQLVRRGLRPRRPRDRRSPPRFPPSTTQNSQPTTDQI